MYFLTLTLKEKLAGYLMLKKLLLLLVAMVFSLPAMSQITAREVFATIDKRLSYMHDVALFKAQQHLAVEDVEREQKIVSQAKTSAVAEGVEPASIEDFFKAQIAVAKAIQYRYRADWLVRPAAEKPRDLQKEVRPALLLLGGRLIHQIARYLKIHGPFKTSQWGAFNTALTQVHVTQADRELLFSALQKVKLKELD